MIYHIICLLFFSLLEYKNVKNKSATSSYKFVLQTRDSNINNFTENFPNVIWIIYRLTMIWTYLLVKMKYLEKCQKPWLTKGLINAINYLYTSLIKYNSKEAENKYKAYKNKLTCILRIAEQITITQHSGNIKLIWKRLGRY